MNIGKKKDKLKVPADTVIYTGSSKKKVKLKIFLLLLVISGVIVATIIGVQQYKEDRANRVCFDGGPIPEGVTASVLASDMEQAEQIRQRISKDSSYTKNADCMAGLVLIHLLKKDSVTAEARFQELNKLADSDHLLSEQFKPLEVRTISDVKKRLNDAVKSREDTKAMEESYEDLLLFQ